MTLGAEAAQAHEQKDNGNCGTLYCSLASLLPQNSIFTLVVLCLYLCYACMLVWVYAHVCAFV